MPADDSMPDASSDKPFDDEPFDAGVEADEKSDPKKYIEQLTGKLGQTLRTYNNEQGQPDFTLEKFVLNSLVSATHTSEMDEEDQNDIINKIKEAGNDDDNQDNNQDDNNSGDSSDDTSGDEFGGDMGDNQADDDQDFGDVNEENETHPFIGTTHPWYKNNWDGGSPVHIGNVQQYLQKGATVYNTRGEEKTIKDYNGSYHLAFTDGSEGYFLDWFPQEPMNENFMLPGKGKRMSIFAPEGSDEFMEVNRLDETNPCWKGYEKVAGKKDFEKGSCKKKKKKKNVNEGEESNNYMFWLNLKGIHDDAVEMLHMDCSAVDELIADGHQWALEHVITSKDDIEEVYHFLEANLEGNDMMKENRGESNNYMFWSSLKTIAHASGELLKMDKTMVDRTLSDGHGWALDHIATSNDDMEEVYHFLANSLNAYDGDTEGGYEDEYGNVEEGGLYEGKYDDKPLGKPTKGDVKKYKVYVKNSKGNVVKVNFGDPDMEIKRDNPERKKSFRARHKCSEKKDRTTPGYWSCKMWSSTPVSKMVSEDLNMSEKRSIFDNIKLKLRETFNQEENMAEPIIEPQIKPVVTPSPDKVQPNIAPSRKNKPFLPMRESQPDPKAKI